MMDQVVKEKWTAALRSGEYKQGDGWLRNRPERARKDRYCCLGVLCDIYAKEKGVDWEQAPGYEREMLFLGQDSYAPMDVQQWAGVGTDDQHELIEMNDNGVSFLKIAKWIESNL